MIDPFTVIQVCSPNTNNLRLNELGRLAAEITSMVPSIAQEWLGILQAIMPIDGNKIWSTIRILLFKLSQMKCK